MGGANVENKISITKTKEPPELIELCVNCTAVSCEHGDCEARRKKVRELARRAEARRVSGDGVREIQVDGLRVSEAARLAGVSYHRVYMRMVRHGMTLQEAIVDALNTKPGNGCTPNLYEVDGVFKTVKQWGQVSGINYRTLQSRLRVGMCMAEAIAKGPGTHGKVPELHVVDGEAHTLREWSRVRGISYETLKGRIKRGMSLAEALAEGPGVWGKVPARYVVDGVERTVGEWAELYGIKADTLRERLRRGLTIAEALERGPGRCER